jgi:hypothetical protein
MLIFAKMMKIPFIIHQNASVFIPTIIISILMAGIYGMIHG